MNQTREQQLEITGKEYQKEIKRLSDELAKMTGIAAMHRNDSAQYQKDLQNLKSSNVRHKKSIVRLKNKLNVGR